jgi:hypothetical protein
MRGRLPVDSWWKWNLQYSAFQNPQCLDDTNRINYHFLAGYANENCGGEPGTRTCSAVSTWDTILIPVVNLLCNDIGKEPGYDNKETCNSYIDRFRRRDLYARWDGKNIPIQRAESPREFRVAGRGNAKHFSDGYWAVVRRPSIGQHTLEVGVTDYDVLFHVFEDELCPNVKYTLNVL